jgi:hypothetical protein
VLMALTKSMADYQHHCGMCMALRVRRRVRNKAECAAVEWFSFVGHLLVVRVVEMVRYQSASCRRNHDIEAG